MSTSTAPGNSTDEVKYDYIYDYLITTQAEAGAFCNAFTTTGAKPFDSAGNANQTAVFADADGAVKTLLVKALGAAKAAALQAERTGAELTASVAAEEKIDQTLSKRLNKIISQVLDADFDGDYYAAANASNPGAATANIDVAYDHGSGAATLVAGVAADNAVHADGPLNADATRLALQVPGTNMAIYATATGTVPTALLLKGGDKVVLGFSVDLESTKANSSQAVSGFNTGKVANSHPNTLTASELTVTNEERSISIALRLQMPGASDSKLTSIRAA
jgi:hypothetical protein